MDRFDLRLKDGNFLRVYRGVYTPVNSNMFVIIRNLQAIVVDPNENEDLMILLKENAVENVYILLTHEHFDHISGVCWLQRHFNCKVICSKTCAPGLYRQGMDFPRLVALGLADKDRADGGHRYQDFKKSFKPFSIQADITYDTPCSFELLGMSFCGYNTPGHSPGSWCLVVEGSFVFTGDTLIKDTPVIVRFHESRRKEFLDITLPFLNSLDPELWVLPGHFDPFILKENNILHTYTD